jgi:hypothetical protein
VYGPSPQLLRSVLEPPHWVLTETHWLPAMVFQFPAAGTTMAGAGTGNKGSPLSESNCQGDGPVLIEVLVMPRGHAGIGVRVGAEVGVGLGVDMGVRAGVGVSVEVGVAVGVGVVTALHFPKLPAWKMFSTSGWLRARSKSSTSSMRPL